MLAAGGSVSGCRALVERWENSEGCGCSPPPTENAIQRPRVGGGGHQRLVEIWGRAFGELGRHVRSSVRRPGWKLQPALLDRQDEVRLCEATEKYNVRGEVYEERRMTRHGNEAHAGRKSPLRTSERQNPRD